MDIEGVVIAALFKEQEDGTTKVSLRTAEPYDAARMAAHFGGGGHVRAAGFSLGQPVDAALALVTPYLEAQIAAGGRPAVS
jgi:bifunctional oligoribonuclease and PAP phosphatase NrnA